jgi:phosphate transport system substrate-binding protein
MKRPIRTSLLILAFLASCLINACSKSGDPAKTRISLSGAWALYPMVVAWSEEYRKEHASVIIDISAGGAGKGMADALSGTVDLGMVSRDINEAEIARGAWWISVVKDAVVPVMNSSNPLADRVLSRGMKKEEFAALWVTGTLTFWPDRDATRHQLRAYTRSDACGAAETWAKYLDANQEDLRGIGVYGDPGIADAVRKDPLGIGYNNINYAYDAKTKRPVQGLVPVPMDLNGNGRIDASENFYATEKEIIAAIADGRYPSPPARNLHLVSRGKPEKKEVLNFLQWILDRGQDLVDQAGYIPLSKACLAEQKARME